MDKCIHEAVCGGCLYQGLPYEEQVLLKGKDVTRILTEYEIKCETFLGITGSPHHYCYRNKMEYTFGDETKGGEMNLGMHKRGSFLSVITSDACQLVDPDFNRILTYTLDFFRNANSPFYHKKSHQGLQRNLIVRKGERTNELLVNLVTTSQMPFDDQSYVKGVLSLPLANHIVGVLHTINDRLADAVNCDELRILWGKDYYEEKIMGLDFKVSAFSFFQTNVPAAENLYTEALNLIHDLEGKTVFDLYCGTGTISQALALRAQEVIGIELSADSVSSAIENAERNSLSNCTFYAGDVFEVLNKLEVKPDVIVLDPPRSGVQPKALDKILAYQVDEILYISCNPKSLMENLKQAEAHGYKAKKMKAYDNFPFTRHIEAVTLLTK